MTLEAWSPDCMEPSEWTEWQRLNPPYRGHGLRNIVLKPDFASRPCADCPAAYAAEMRAVGRCNGTPAEVAA